jgi:hypothetical protein
MGLLSRPISPLTPDNNSVYSFNPRRVGNIVSYTWTFLDGPYTHALWATHIYTNTPTVCRRSGVQDWTTMELTQAPPCSHN